MIERSNFGARVTNPRLAWDMAHAEKPLRDEVHRMKKSGQERNFSYGGATPGVLLERAIDQSSEIEKAYYEKVAKQDEDYFAIEDLYGGLKLNKEDLYAFLTSSAENDKELKTADKLTTRVWNMLGVVSSEPNSDVLFDQTIPTGVKRPAYISGRNYVGSEIVQYKNLDLASLIHFLDTATGLPKQGRPIYGIGAVSLKAMTNFANYEIQKNS